MKVRIFCISITLISFGVGVLGCSSVPVRKIDPVASSRKGYLDRKDVVDGFNVRRTPKLGIVRFQWPLQEVKLTSGFGKRGREFHEGIDLRATEGTPVFAAQRGVVLYADRGIRGYGKLIVLRHYGKIATLYAHNSEVFVKRGDIVERGQQIALTGETGRVRGPHLHFEVRKGVSALNPLVYLPNKVGLKKPQTTSYSSKVKKRGLAPPIRKEPAAKFTALN